MKDSCCDSAQVLPARADASAVKDGKWKTREVPKVSSSISCQIRGITQDRTQKTDRTDQFKMDRSPSLSSSQEASPVLATIAGMAKNKESGQGEHGQISLVASLTKAIRQKSPCKTDEFWEALQSHYNYLMDRELIETCKEANGELAWDETDLTCNCIWTFTQFMDQYKQILEWMDKMQKECADADDHGRFDEMVRKSFLDEMEDHLMLQKMFNEQAQRLIKRYPNLENEINCHLTHVNNRWERMKEAIATHKDSKDVLKDVNLEIGCLRKWLREMESKLLPLTVYSGWALEDLETKYVEHQALQKDIESHGKNVKSVLRLCDHVQFKKESTVSRGGGYHVHRIAQNLERRWQKVWLRSLEWQCLLEELISKSKQGLLTEDQLESSFNDEPLTKFPRLSGEWTGKTLWSQRGNDNLTDEENHPESDWYPLPDSDWEEELTSEGMELDRQELDAPMTDQIEQEMKTRDVGTDYESVDFPATNEKGVMVGSTGITELKADCEGDYKNFEIIQDIGYSSESSAQLSNDERGDTIHIYTYNENGERTSESIPAEMAEPEKSPENGPPSNERDTSRNDDCVACRATPNCATFYFRHIDTDNECRTDDLTSDAEKEGSFAAERRFSNESGETSDHMHSPSIVRRRQWSDTMLSVKPSSARMDVEFLTDVESPVSSQSDEEMRGTRLLTDNEKLHHLGLRTSLEWDREEYYEKSSGEFYLPSDEYNPPDDLVCDNKRDSIQELVEGAERLVQEDKKDVLEQMAQPVWLGEARAKKSRLKEWLNSHETFPCLRPAALPPETVIDSSCDASGEYTSSNDSEDEHSVSSEEQNNSVIACFGDRVLATEGMGEPKTPTNEVAKPITSASDPPKVVMRNKKRNCRDRPWSMTESKQLTNRLDLTSFSISESALNNLLSSQGRSASEFKDGSSNVDVLRNNASTSTDTTSGSSARKTKSTKSRKRYMRRSDSGSEGASHSRCSVYPTSGGSDGGSQKSPFHRRQSLHSKSHSSGSDSGRKQYSLCGSGGGKSASHSSGTEQYSSEAALGDNTTLVKVNDLATDSESELTRICPPPPKLHLSEELSSLSEQAWDDYQDSPYLSEPYSEKLIDGDQVRRLMEFGDDYRMYIESHSDTASQSSYSGKHCHPSRRGRGFNSRSQTVENLDNLEPVGIDSDSDLEDLHHILKESSNQLQFSNNFLRKQMAKKENGNPVDYIEFLATCHTNIQCLQILDKNLDPKKEWSSTVETNIKDVITGWEMLQAHAQKEQLGCQQTTHKLKVQREMSDLRDSMNNINNSINDCMKQIENKDIMERMIREVQAYLSALQDKKTVLLTINLQVHNFLTKGSGDFAPLKTEVDALYYLWDQVFERSNNQLNALKGLKSTWTKYEANYEELSATLQKDQEQIGNQRLHDQTASMQKAENLEASPTVEREAEGSAPTSAVVAAGVKLLDEEQLMARHVQLAALQVQAKQLEGMLADTEAWNTISQQLNDVNSELCHLKEKCREQNTVPTLLEMKKMRFSVPGKGGDISQR